MSKHLNITSILLTTLIIVSCSSAWVYVEKVSKKTMVCNPAELPHMVKLPIFKSAWQIIGSCDVHFPADTALAIIVFENRWFENFGRSEEVFRALEGLVIEWSNEEKFVSGYFTNGKPYANRLVTGLLLGPGHVWVYTDTGMKVCQTSLVHELVHAAIRSKKGTDGDPDHEGSRFSGWTRKHTKFIKEVNKEICKLGL